MKEQEKGLDTELKEMEISNLPYKQFKVTIIRIFTELKGSIDEHRENFDKEVGNIKSTNQNLRIQQLK